MTNVIHGAWHTPPNGSGVFCLWAESSLAEPPTPRSAKKSAARSKSRIPTTHPFALNTSALQELLAPSLAEKPDPTTLVMRLPARQGTPVASPELHRAEQSTTGKLTLTPFAVGALQLDTLTALTFLVTLPDERSGAQISADLRFWSLAAKFALELVTRQRFVPTIVKVGQTAHARWHPVLNDPHDSTRMNWLAQAMPPAARAAGTTDIAPHALLDAFINTTVDTCVRRWAVRAREAKALAKQTTEAGAWMTGLLNEQGRGLTLNARALDARLEQQGTWMAPLTENPEATPAHGFRICFRLDPPPRPTETPTRATTTDWTLHYFLQAHDDPSLLVPAAQVWRERGKALTFLNRRFDQPQEHLLAGLGQAARMSPAVERSLHDARPSAISMALDEAYHFLSETAVLLQNSGFGVLMPADLSQANQALSIRAKLSSPKRKSEAGAGTLNLTALVSFDWQLALGGEVLARAEFEALAALKVPLVQIRGQWVMLDHTRLEAALKLWQTSERNSTLTVGDALRLGLPALAPDGEGSATRLGLPVTSVEATGWIGTVLHELSHATTHQLPLLTQPHDLQGTLRPYQVQGFSWLAFLRTFGLGACLADDMGLGKTIETIAHLLHLRQHGLANGPTLLICPTSVVGNWHREVTRFAPDLRVLIHHGIGRGKGAAFAKQAQAHDIVLSSYGLLHRDREHLERVAWDTVVLDEAQNIKNTTTKSAQAARALHTQHRIALTGTPVENRLTELWSIMEFLNPGYLGSYEHFRHEFALPIERYHEPQPAQRLKALVRPFVLRRLKTDRSVIQDLPDKLELKVYCPLTREQATLYEAVARDTLQQVDQAAGIQRRGLVLALLTRLKQICNHPAHYLADGSPLSGRSGKLTRLTEMLAEMLAAGDRALIFTQFTEMGELLRTHLAETLGIEVLFLHGAVTLKKRDELVARFQNETAGPPIFLLSLKAGGVGLNLTRANHVFHFDRWWNPAVENQATDRAFRIGQTRNVLVHKFVCAGTLEERIDELIESKKALAEQVVGAGEGWLTELSTRELRDMLTLRQDAIADE